MHNKISHKAAELWRLMCYLNDSRPPSWILAQVKFGGISVSGTSALVSETNFMWIHAIPTDLWPLKWTFKMAATAILDFFFGIEISSQRKSRPACIYLHPHQFWWRYINGRPSAELWRFMCFQNGGRPPSWIFAEVKFWLISVSGTSVLVSEPNFVRICAIAAELQPFEWIYKIAAAAILDFSEVKFDVTGSHGRPVSTSTPNLLKIPQRAAELWGFVCFQNGGRPPYWIFAEVKLGGISVSGTSDLVSESNFVRCAIATQLWPFKWIFKMAAAAILNLLPVSIFFI